MATSAGFNEDTKAEMMEDRQRTYRWLVRGTLPFAAHVLAILLVPGLVLQRGDRVASGVAAWRRLYPSAL
jgi:hypothetical protein